jgi:hypothetical protein
MISSSHAQRSCAVLEVLGPSIQWVQSYVTEDKITEGSSPVAGV